MPITKHRLHNFLICLTHKIANHSDKNRLQSLEQNDSQGVTKLKKSVKSKLPGNDTTGRAMS